MKKLFLSLLSLVSLSANAQVTDASSYFDNKPFGWATCSSVDGTAYNVNGGIGYGDPKTITLTASGGDDDDAIKKAVASNDIIYLDGSKGDFTIATQMKFSGVSNKTIVGINNARLCTKFWLTPEIRAALKAAKLESLSSTKQITGTLPNGQTLTCDERAFYTKKTMMEATGDMDMTFAKSGVFAFDGTDKNIIIRNITFQGPGSVDVDGVDLISQYGGNHVWIDHCEFIDGMDGNLDTGKKPGMYVTYSWNVFRYTERSFSHPYSNGCGWLDDATEPQLFITYANCVWGSGCGRRLPQCGATNLHLLNCLYDCAGNDVGCAVNGANSVALIEGNYSCSGVKSPLEMDTKVPRYTLKNNYFTSYTSLNNKEKGGGMTVPYEYSAFDCNEALNILYAPHGAGATLDNDNVLPVVKANDKPETPNGEEIVYLYSDGETKAQTLTFKGGYKLKLNKDGKEYQPANAITVDNDETYSSIKLSNGAQNILTLPEGKAATKVTFFSYVNKTASEIDGARNSYWKEVNGTAFTGPQMTCPNDKPVSNPDINTYDLPNVSSFTFTNTGEQLAFVIRLEVADATSIGIIEYDPQNSGADGNGAAQRAAYNLAGQRVAPDTKGIIILNGKKIFNK